MCKFRIILGGVFLAILLSSCGDATTAVPTPGVAIVATPVPTIRTSISREELNYPGARVVSEKELFPDGVPDWLKESIYGAFITTASQTQILDFYQKRLVSMGLGYEPNTNCQQPGTCQKLYGLEGDITECTPDKRACGSTYQISFLLVDRTATPQDDENHNIPDNFYSLAKLGQTLVVYSGGPYRPFTPPPANPTTAGVPESSLTPTVKK